MDKKPIYKPNIKKLNGVLDHPQIYTVLSVNDAAMAKKAAEYLDHDLKKGGRSLRPEGIAKIKNTFGMLTKLAMEITVTPIFTDLVNEFIILGAAWNESVEKNPEFRQMLYNLRKLIDCHYSFSDLIRMSKTLIQKIEAIQKFSPPAFEVSRHYLEAIQKLETGKKAKPMPNK